MWGAWINAWGFWGELVSLCPLEAQNCGKGWGGPNSYLENPLPCLQLGSAFQPLTVVFPDFRGR